MSHSQRNAKGSRYVLVTAARNEEAYIEKTITSVIAQSILPQKWVIVSDGSTDRTDQIVKRYEGAHDFIELVHREGHVGRSFASKVYAIREGLARLNRTKYAFLGNLDADVSFEPSYYERVLGEFREDPKLGIAGGILFEPCHGKWVAQRTSTSWSVSGPIQMFRRQCYEDIGGFVALRDGGEDAVAEVMARMSGWKVKAFANIAVRHHRNTGTATGSILWARFRRGKMERRIGYHPLFEIAKCGSRVLESPYVIGSFCELGGYCWDFLRRDHWEVPTNVVRFLRHEQIQRMYTVLSKKTRQ